MDYRQSACSNAVLNKVFLGNCNNHKKQSDFISTYYNTTSPTPVPKNGDRNGGGLCDCTEEWTTTASGSNWASAFIGAEWWQQDASGSPYPTDMLTGVQSYASGSSVDLGNCFNYGFKNVGSRRSWHGRFGFTSNDSCAQDRSIAPDQTKYLTIAGTVSFKNYDQDGTRYLDPVNDPSSPSYDSSAPQNPRNGQILDYTELKFDGSVSVNGSTGIITVTGTGITGIGYGHNPDGTVYHSGSSTQADFGMDYLLSMVSGCDIPAFYAEVLTTSSAVFLQGCESPALPPDYDCIPIPISHSRVVTNTHHEIHIATFLETLGSYRFEYNSFHGTLDLSGENKASDLVKDCEGLLTEWDLGSDTQYPWRHDNFTAFMPLVCRREVQSNVAPSIQTDVEMDDYRSPIYTSGSISGYNKMGWLDPNSYWWKWAPGSSSVLASSLESTHYDGSTIGKPLYFNSGSALGWGWFDFYYGDIRFCKTPSDMYDCGSSPFYEEFTYRYGGTLADADVSVSGLTGGPQFSTFLPMEATHWVNNAQAHSIPRGASVGCGIADGGIFAVKWAETRIATPSYNFFRPCASDRVMIDETTAQCLIDDSLTMDSELVGLTGGSQVLVAFSTGYDGIYTGCSQTPSGVNYTLTLGTKISDLPSDYFHPFEDAFKDADILGNYGLVGLIRFPSAYPLCGRQQMTITGSNTGSIITFLSPQTNLRVGDKLDLYKYPFNVVASNKNVDARFDDFNFYLSSSYSGSITASIYAQSNGSPDYHWNDPTQKYEYRQATWFTSNRSESFNASSSCQGGCVNFTNCNPSVVCFSPNVESFKDAQRFWFGFSNLTGSQTATLSGSFSADGVYGSIEQQNAEFSVGDPLYQRPKFPCSTLGLGITPIFRQDDGQCAGDTFDPETGNPIYYYPPTPLVEALCSTPSGSPALPSGTGWPALSRPGLPGVIGYSYYFTTEPWNLLSNELNNCTDACRFRKWYIC